MVPAGVRRIGRKLADADSLDSQNNLPAGAHEHWTANFVILLVTQTLSKIGDVLASPRHVLVWWLGAAGVPASLLGALVPVREAGALLPQLWLGAWMRHRTRRRAVYVTGLFVQGIAIGGIAFAATSLEGPLLGWVAIAAIAVFSIGRSAASLASKDLLGRTIPKGRRGRLGGTSASVAGILTIAAGVALGLQPGDTPGAAPLVLVLGAVAGWLLAALSARTLVEPEAEAEDGTPHPFRDLRLLREDSTFARFCLARGLLAGTVLSMPYVAMLAKESTSGGSAGLGALLVAGSAAQFVSGWIWGRAADTSSRRTMMFGGAMASSVLALTFVTAGFEPSGTTGVLLYGALFFLLGLAHTGIRQGRKTYVVDLAPDDLRPTYVAVANTVMGLVLLASTLLGTLASLFDPRVLVVVLAVLGAAGAWVAKGLREVEDGAVET